MWTITTSTGRNASINSLMNEYENLFAADESGWEVDPQDMLYDPEKVADAGYGARDTRRILFWATESDSENDPGEKSVAEARWEE